MHTAKKKIKKRPFSKSLQSIGLLCSGGDAPGMNAAVRAVVRAGICHGLRVHGVFRGYSGLLEGDIHAMDLRSVANIIQRGGTILKTDRCKAFLKKSVRAEAANLLRRNKIDALVVIGGEGSYTGAHLLGVENKYPVIGLPGTIDNDIVGSEYSIGFDTAVNTALEAIDRIRDTANSHDRIFLVEVMGRTSSEIAIRVGVSGGAETIIVPEHKHPAQHLIASLKRSIEQGKSSSIVIVAEGTHAGGSYALSEAIKKEAGLDSRVVVLGHVQRGGVPSALDRYMASLMGAEAVQTLLDGQFDCSIGVVGGKIARIPFQVSIGQHKKTDQELLRLAEILAS